MVDVDLSQLPFTLLDDEGRDHIRRGIDLAYFDRDEIILETGQAGEFVFLIHKGEVAEIDPSYPHPPHVLATIRRGISSARSVFSMEKAVIGLRLSRSASVIYCPRLFFSSCAATTPISVTSFASR